MGYESRLYVVDKCDKFSFEDRCCGEVIAMFNLCKVYSVSDKMRQYPETDCYIYAADGNTHIIEDGYGDIMREISIDDAKALIELKTLYFSQRDIELENLFYLGGSNLYYYLKRRFYSPL